MKLIKQSYLWPALGAILFCTLACGSDSPTNDSSESVGISGDGSVADIIRIPVTANEDSVDLSQLAKLVFEEDAFDFGEVDAGAVLEHTFTFTNEGVVPLIITDVRSTCGCTVADWPRNAIPPGKSGEIPVKFDTKNKNGRQSKPVTITANTYPSKSVIYMNVRVYGTD